MTMAIAVLMTTLYRTMSRIDFAYAFVWDNVIKDGTLDDDFFGFYVDDTPIVRVGNQNVQGG